MSAYNFKSRWEAALVEDGHKKTTLRVDRKDGRIPKVGQTFSAFVGMRTKSCRKLFDSVITKVERLVIEPIHPESEFGLMDYSIYLNGELMTRLRAHRMAQRDGFYDLDAFLEFFETEHLIHAIPFRGWLIYWK